MAQIGQLQSAMRDIQSAANQEQKSSMGDKYETGRAMMQQEQDKLAGQLEDATKRMRLLEQINPIQVHSVVGVGSLVITNQARYFIATSMGQLNWEGESYFIVSLASPIGQVLKEKKSGDEVIFNNRTLIIKDLA